MKIATRQQPECGHKQLVECPLTVEDWNDVFTAYLGFRYQCLLISERAHSRRAPNSGDANAESDTLGAVHSAPGAVEERS